MRQNVNLPDPTTQQQERPTRVLSASLFRMIFHFCQGSGRHLVDVLAQDCGDALGDQRLMTLAPLNFVGNGFN